MFVVHSVECAVDQPAALLQRRQEVSLILINDVHDLKEEPQQSTAVVNQQLLMTASCYIISLIVDSKHWNYQTLQLNNTLFTASEKRLSDAELKMKSVLVT